MLQQSHWTDKTIAYWVSKSIKLEAGVPEEKIASIEEVMGLKFPSDFRELYLKVNGFADNDWNEGLFSLWPIQRIYEEYHGNGDASYIGFCDYLINSHTIGFDRADGHIYKDYDQAAPIAESFRHFIELLNNDDDLLY